MSLEKFSQSHDGTRSHTASINFQQQELFAGTREKLSRLDSIAGAICGSSVRELSIVCDDLLARNTSGLCMPGKLTNHN